MKECEGGGEERNKPIAFLTSLLPSPSSLLKLPNERGNEGERESGLRRDGNGPLSFSFSRFSAPSVLFCASQASKGRRTRRKREEGPRDRKVRKMRKLLEIA